MDKAKAIELFVERVEQLTRLPLISDTEMENLYGEEVSAVLRELALLNDKEQFCQNCQTRCCPAIKCELYTPRFKQCPIYELRPPVCRLHYCHRFFTDNDHLLKEISDIFFDSLLTAESLGSDKARLFDCPPLSICCPELVNATKEWMDLVREGKLDPEAATVRIRQEAEKYRSPAVKSST